MWGLLGSSQAAAETIAGGPRIGSTQEHRTLFVCQDFTGHPSPLLLKLIIQKGGFFDTFNVHLHDGLLGISIFSFLRSGILFI